MDLTNKCMQITDTCEHPSTAHDGDNKRVQTSSNTETSDHNRHSETFISVILQPRFVSTNAYVWCRSVALDTVCVCVLCVSSLLYWLARPGHRSPTHWTRQLAPSSTERQRTQWPPLGRTHVNQSAGAERQRTAEQSSRSKRHQDQATPAPGPTIHRSDQDLPRKTQHTARAIWKGGHAREPSRLHS